MITSYKRPANHFGFLLKAGYGRKQMSCTSNIIHYLNQSMLQLQVYRSWRDYIAIFLLCIIFCCYMPQVLAATMMFFAIVWIWHVWDATFAQASSMPVNFWWVKHGTRNIAGWDSFCTRWRSWQMQSAPAGADYGQGVRRRIWRGFRKRWKKMNLINPCVQFVWSVLSKRIGFQFPVYFYFGHSFCGICPLVFKSHYFHCLPD